MRSNARRRLPPQDQLRRRYIKWRIARAQPWPARRHWIAGAVAATFIARGIQVAATGDADHSTASALAGVMVIIAGLAASTALYCVYYFPAVICAMLFAQSFAPNAPLSHIRLTVLASGALAGAAYTVVTQRWRSVALTLARTVPDSVVQDCGRGLFEIGRRYLAAWALVLITGIIATFTARMWLSELEPFLEEAGGIVVLIDLVALLPSRWRRAAALRRPPRPRPYPRVLV